MINIEAGFEPLALTKMVLAPGTGRFREGQLSCCYSVACRFGMGWGHAGACEMVMVRLSSSVRCTAGFAASTMLG